MCLGGIGQENLDDFENIIPDMKHLSLSKATLLFERVVKKKSSSNYIFILKQFSNKRGCQFFFINKKNLIDVITDNNNLFKDRLGESFDVYSFIKKLESGDYHLFDRIHRDEILLGILLGYGKENAILFSKGRALQSSSNEFYSILSPLALPQFACNPETMETKRLMQRYEKDKEHILITLRSRPFVDVIFEKLK